MVIRVGGQLNTQVAVSALLLVASPLSPTTYGLERFWETLVGAAVTVGVAPLIFPPNPLREVAATLERVTANLVADLRASAALVGHGSPAEADANLERGTVHTREALGAPTTSCARGARSATTRSGRATATRWSTSTRRWCWPPSWRSSRSGWPRTWRPTRPVDDLAADWHAAGATVPQLADDTAEAARLTLRGDDASAAIERAERGVTGYREADPGALAMILRRPLRALLDELEATLATSAQPVDCAASRIRAEHDPAARPLAAGQQTGAQEQLLGTCGNDLGAVHHRDVPRGAPKVRRDRSGMRAGEYNCRDAVLRSASRRAATRAGSTAAPASTASRRSGQASQTHRLCPAPCAGRARTAGHGRRPPPVIRAAGRPPARAAASATSRSGASTGTASRARTAASASIVPCADASTTSFTPMPARSSARRVTRSTTTRAGTAGVGRVGVSASSTTSSCGIARASARRPPARPRPRRGRRSGRRRSRAQTAAALLRVVDRKAVDDRGHRAGRRGASPRRCVPGSASSASMQRHADQLAPRSASGRPTARSACPTPRPGGVHRRAVVGRLLAARPRASPCGA